MQSHSNASSLPRWPLIVLATGNFAIGMGSLVVAGILRLIASDLHVTVSAVGQLVTVYALTYAIASPLLVIWVGHLPRRILLLAGLAGVLLGNLLGVIAPGYAVLVLARIVSALGAALFTPLASGVAAAISPPAQRGQAIGIVFGGLTIATAFGVPLGTFLGNQFGWRATLLVVALVSIIAMIAIYQVIASTVTTPAVNVAIWGQVLRQPGLLLAASVTFWQSTAQFVVFTYISPFLATGMGLKANGITLLLLAFGVASIAGNFVAGALADSWGPRRTVSVTLLGLAIALLLISLAPRTLLVILPALILWGMAGFGFNTPQQARLVQLAPSLGGVLLTLNASALYLGSAAGAATGGTLAHGRSLLGLGYVGAVIALVALGILATTWQMEEQRQLEGVRASS